MEPSQLQGSSSQQHQPPLPNNSSRVRFAEEQPGLEAVHRPQSPSAGHKSRDKKAPVESAPEVYWADDRENDPNLSQYTFYREPTPTPPEYEEHHYHRKGLGYGASAPAVAGDSGGGGNFPPSTHGHGGEDQWSTTSSNNLVCGVRRVAFWTIIGIVILFLIALALGVGLGVGLTKTDAPPGPSSSSSSSPAISDSASQPSPTSTIASSDNPTCPGANNTIYTTMTDTKETFLVVCGVDYSGRGGATDLKHVPTKTMAECIDECALFPKCTGCGWGHIAGDKGTSHRCWLKTDLQKPHKATKGWNFAVLQRE